MPGLVGNSSDAHSRPHAAAAVNASSSDERYAGTGAGGTGGTHRLLVSPDAFHVSVLFAPTLAFLDRVSEIMPGGLAGGGSGDEGDRGFGAFLEDFVLHVFLPQLEDKVAHVYRQAVSDDAFVEDPASRKLATVPIVKSVANLVGLTKSLSTMLRATPFHREDYARLIVSVINQFFGRCQERFRDLTSRDGGELADGGQPLAKMASLWAQRPTLVAVLAQLRASLDGNGTSVDAPLREELRLEMDMLGERRIETGDLIGTNKRLVGLATLYSSIVRAALAGSADSRRHGSSSI